MTEIDVGPLPALQARLLGGYYLFMPIRGLITGLFVFAVATTSLWADGPVLPPFDDLVRLLRTNLVLNPGEFDHEAGRALVENFGGQILGPNDLAETLSDTPVLAKRTMLESGCIYARIGQVTPALGPQLTAALADTNWINGAKGLILDLRFASGTSFKAAAEAAALFVTPNHKLLDWGEDSFLPVPSTNAWKLPIAVLVNRETSGAAESLAAVLRAENTALIIGNTTAGKAAVFREIEVGEGTRLRLPVAQSKTSDGKSIPRSGMPPDIAVKVTLEQERAYLADPFITVISSTNSPSGTNTVVGTVTVRHRLNEAELVRSRRGESGSGDATPKPEPPKSETRIVRDPTLARAVDVIKGLAVLNRR